MAGNITLAMRTAQSGLLASQGALDSVANNIANANTPGYSRKIVQLEQRVVSGTGAGALAHALCIPDDPHSLWDYCWTGPSHHHQKGIHTVTGLCPRHVRHLHRCRCTGRYVRTESSGRLPESLDTELLCPGLCSAGALHVWLL